MNQIASVSFLAADLRDLRAALATEAALGALVALFDERVRGPRDRGLHEPPFIDSTTPCTGQLFRCGP